MLRRYVATAIAPLKDHPALHSICLSNEPVNQEEPCDAARKLWQAWLQKRHGDIAHLNACYDGKFASLAEVPLPDPFGPRPAMPRGWITCGSTRSSLRVGTRCWPTRCMPWRGLPVHAKAMTWTFAGGSDSRLGVDATLFGRFSDINGNDSVNFYQFGEGEFAQGWREQCAVLRHAAVGPRALRFSTRENHIIHDRDTRYVPARHIRAALWQEAIHGQCASAIWVWERSWDPASDRRAVS